VSCNHSLEDALHHGVHKLAGMPCCSSYPCALPQSYPHPGPPFHPNQAGGALRCPSWCWRGTGGSPRRNPASLPWRPRPAEPEGPGNAMVDHTVAAKRRRRLQGMTYARRGSDKDCRVCPGLGHWSLCMLTALLTGSSSTTSRHSQGFPQTMDLASLYHRL
jgi:hypothetical protein